MSINLESRKSIDLDGVTKVYPGGQLAVDHVTFTVEQGEFMVLVGPSGCGKSTLLRMIAGLEEITEGRLSIGGRDVTQLAPRERDIAMVFQNYALYPHMTVRENLGYGLRVRKVPKAEARAKVDDVARMLGLDQGGMLDRLPAALSGGQRQRVAMGRAIVREPAAYLMDEPLSNLDAKLRVGMRAELSRLHAKLGTTTVYVTHDQVEAMTLGQRVTVMRGGTIQQIGRPQDLYAMPCNLFVAAFIGSPAMNTIEATVEDENVLFGSYSVPLAPGRRPRRDGPVVLGIRPSAFADPELAPTSMPRLDVEVAVVEELGSETHVIFWVDARRVTPEGVIDAASNEDAQLLADDERSLCTATLPARNNIGSRTTLALDPNTLHFFDPITGGTLLASKTRPTVVSS
jgi:multiple sugar transport system ATP-binding protein